MKAMKSLLALLLVAGLAGCDGGPPDDSAVGATPGAADSRDVFAAAGADADARSTPRPAHAAAPITLALVGEIERPDGSVQRSYRALLQPGTATSSEGLRAELVDAGAGRRVTQRLARFDASAGAPVVADRLLQIVQRDTQPLDPAALRWVLTPLDVLQGAQGALLPGAPQARATETLRDYRWSAVPGAAGVRLAAVLRPEAQVEDVNQALRETGLRIAAMRPGNHTLELRSPQGGGAAALQPVAQRLQASAAFEWVRVQPAAPATVEALAAAAPDPNACHE